MIGLSRTARQFRVAGPVTRVKNGVNSKLNAAMGSAGVNYLASKAAFQAVRDELALEGWSLVMRNSGGAVETDLDLATWTQFRRAYVMSITRDPAHQSIAEQKGWVQPGQNTYERIVTEQATARVGCSLRDGEADDSPRVTISEPVAVAGESAVNAHRLGSRPVNRLRDL